MTNKFYDVAIIGGGFYGCILALFLKTIYKNVVIVEKEADLLLKASQNNQARIHNGYHYPRSMITALRSHKNYSRFIKDFAPAVVDTYLMTYAIATNNSKITSSQFMKFCQNIGSPISPAPEKVTSMFDRHLIESVFVVEENVFNVDIVRDILKKKLLKNHINILYQSEVAKIIQQKERLCLELTSGETIISTMAINCAYAGINTILKHSSLPLLPLKYELTEMPLVTLPVELRKMGITILDGPFFSLMPFPSKNLHTIHHVRYTPHTTQIEGQAIKEKVLLSKNSRFIYMLKDARRYIPLLEKPTYHGSLYETKTILTQTEFTDARPILFRKDYGMKNFHVVMGGKIDNVYDILEEFKTLYAT